MRRPATAEQGNFAVVELVTVAGLILLPTVALTALLPIWIERQSLARLAAQETARTVALADNAAAGLHRADELTDELAANHGADPHDDLAVEIDGEHRRGGEITATATITVPALPVPFVSTPTFTLAHSHTERIDDYRSYAP